MSFGEVEKVIGKPLDKAHTIGYYQIATETKHLNENASDFVVAAKGP
jgi:hypothetical protein